jgi:hypothetical protein
VLSFFLSFFLVNCLLFRSCCSASLTMTQDLRPTAPRRTVLIATKYEDTTANTPSGPSFQTGLWSASSVAIRWLLTQLVLTTCNLF